MNKTALFDDTFYYITIDDEDHHLTCSYEFNECLRIILTDKQYYNFITDDIVRIFKVSKKRIDAMIKYINSDGNPYRK